MMRHIELNFYWLYEYLRGDGSQFVTTEELTENEMVLNDAKLKNKVQIHYKAEEKDVKSKHNDMMNMMDAWLAAEKQMIRNKDKSNLTFTPLVGPGDELVNPSVQVPGWVRYAARDFDGRLRGHRQKPKKDRWLGKWVSENEYGKTNNTYTFTDDFDNGVLRWRDKEPAKLIHENFYKNSKLEKQNAKTIYSIMEVVLDDNQLMVRQVFSFDTECEVEIVLDYINELQPERKFYIREDQVNI